MDALETIKLLHLARSSVLHESMRSSVVVAQAAAQASGVANLNCPQERGQEHWGMIQEPVVSASIVQQLLGIGFVNVQVYHCSVSHHAKRPRVVLNLLHVPASFSRNRVHEDSPSFGLIGEILAYLCPMWIQSETFRHTTPTKPTVRESLPQCEMFDVKIWMQ